MRRSIIRILLPTVLALALCVPAAGAAAASPAAGFPRFAGRFSPSLPSVFRGILDGRRTDRKFHARGFAGSFRVPGSPYRWSVEVARVTNRWVLTIAGDHQLINGYQSHAWQFSLPLGDASTGRLLQTAHVNTGTALGPFGKIDLTFHSAKRLRQRIERCPKTHDLVIADVRRPGMLRGSLHFTPNEGTLPALSVTTIRASAERVRFTGARCPGNGHPHGCFVQTGFGFTDPSQHAQAGGSVRGPFPNANRDFSVLVRRRVGPATEFHFITAEAATPVVKLHSPGVVVDASALAPLLSGSLTFESGATTRWRGAACKIATTQETWVSGTLTVAFDSGTVMLTEGTIRARLVAYTRP